MLAAIVRRTALFATIWIVLSENSAESVAFGLPAVAGAVWMSLRLQSPAHGLRLWRAAALLPGFLAGSLAGGLDVARRAFSLRPVLRPGWVVHSTSLLPGGRVALGGELSLMPGTLAAGCEGDRLLVHVLDCQAGFEGGIGTQEKRLARVSEGP
ncbi:MAG: multicomponent Na+:H+ antiporter subunit MnhE [Rhodobacteraceae bacterium HLUCCA12]|nr:MAG: multicomponent Na+:H+ antiporter subunit MnhE [Rhodobacteraceae bacterium HLUCCA12]